MGCSTCSSALRLKLERPFFYCNRLLYELWLVLESGGKGLGAVSIQVKQAQSIWTRGSDIDEQLHHPESEVLRSQNQQSCPSAATGWPGRLEQGLFCAMNPVSRDLGQRCCCLPRELCLEAWQFGRGSLSDKPCSFPMPHA